MSHLSHGEVNLSHEGLQYDREAVVRFVAFGVDQFSHGALDGNANTASRLLQVDQRKSFQIVALESRFPA